MADQAPEVKVKLTAEDTGVAAAIKSLGDRLSELKTQSKDTTSSFGELKNVLGSLVSAAAVYKLVEFGKEVFNTTVSIERMSQRTGLSAGMLSTFNDAAEESGVATEQANQAIGRLATSVTKFQQGSTQAAAAFKALNITQADFKNLSPDEKMRLVIDRLGGMEAGFQKNATAQALMGRGGGALIPVLQELAGAGFDKVTESAIRSGNYLSDQMAVDAAEAAATFVELEQAGKGIATQFEAGLLPALTDVADSLTNEIEDGGVSSFKALGEEAGTVVKTLVLAWQIGAHTIGAILLTLYEVVASQFKQLGNVVETLGEAGIDAARGHFAEAGRAIAAGFRNGGAIARKEVEDVQSTWTALADVVTKQSATLFPATPKKRALPKTGGGGDDDIDDNKADKARLAALEARLQEEGALFKAKNAKEEAENQIAYDKGLESLKTFFARRKKLAQDESDEQISILRRERAAVAASPTDGTDAGEIAKKQKLAKFDNEIAVAKIAATTKQEQLDQQLFTAEESRRKTLLGYQAEILALQGLTYEAAIAKIQGEEAEVRRSLAQSGLSPAAVDAMVAKIQQLKTATAKFDEDKKDGEDALKTLADERAAINLQVTAGLETQYGAEQRIAQLELQRVPELQKIAAAMHAAAINPDQVRAADEFAQKIQAIQVNATAAANQMQQFGKQAGTAIQGDLNTFLTSTIISARTVGQAFQQLAGSVVGSIQKIVTQLLIQIVTQKLLQAITHQSDNPGQKVASAAAAGVAQATPLIAAGTVMTTAGGVIITAGIGLGVSAAALQIAADTLIIANSMGGGGGGMAAGGLVTGPGGPTSDSIPARLSNGEFVVRAAAVRAVGLDALATINRGLRIPSIGGFSIPRFAEGGLVHTDAGHGGADIRIGLGLDQGLVLKHLESKAAGKIMLQHIANNPKAAGKALQRGE